MPALERVVTALATRSFPTPTSTFSEGEASVLDSETGEAQTDDETKVGRNNFRALAKERGSISWELNGDSRPGNEGLKPRGQPG